MANKVPLYLQVLIAVVLALIFGLLSPENAQSMKPLGDGFIKLVKMCIAPLIFVTITLGIVGSFDMKKIGRLGLKALIYFELLTTLAMIIGLAVGMWLKPGSGMNIDPTMLDASAISSYTAQASHKSFSDFILNIIPTTIFQAFVSGEILPVLFVAVFFGFALSAVQEQAQSVIKGIHELAEILFKIISFITKLAPIGAFGAMSYAVGKYGAVILWPLIKLMLCFYITCILFVILVFGLMLKLCGRSIFDLLRHIKEEIFLVFGTCSSESALPSLMKKMESFGCSKPVTSLIIPTGYSFNLDGTCIYFTMAILFIAQACNINLSLEQIIGIILVLLITSKGAAGVVGSAFVVLAGTLTMIPEIPAASLVLILGIDRFMAEARAVTNLIGNATATVVIDRLEK